jgi:hypothetical protein
MKKSFFWPLWLVACVLLVGCHTPHHHETVEYKQVFHSGKRQGLIEPVLNELAKEGWRVVGYQGFAEQEVWVLLERKK